jgi:hypothetical protein
MNIPINPNGRINILQPNTNNLFQLYDKIPIHQISTLRNPTQGIWDDTKLSTLFFSKENVIIIQNGIRAGVYRRSDGHYIIDPQDYDTLSVIMRSIYLENSKNQSTHITRQLEDLNRLVVDYSVDNVFKEAQGYLCYLKDASTMYEPIDHPKLMSSHKKTIEFKKFF